MIMEWTEENVRAKVESCLSIPDTHVVEVDISRGEYCICAISIKGGLYASEIEAIGEAIGNMDARIDATDCDVFELIVILPEVGK